MSTTKNIGLPLQAKHCIINVLVERSESRLTEF
jgi:hypothetical protein